MSPVIIMDEAYNKISAYESRNKQVLRLNETLMNTRRRGNILILISQRYKMVHITLRDVCNYYIRPKFKGADKYVDVMVRDHEDVYQASEIDTFRYDPRPVFTLYNTRQDFSYLKDKDEIFYCDYCINKPNEVVKDDIHRNNTQLQA